MFKAASVTGRTVGVEIDERRVELTAQTGLNPIVTFAAEYFDETQQMVQFGNTITITLTYTTQFHGFGVFSIPITLTATHSGLSQRYWK